MSTKKKKFTHKNLMNYVQYNSWLAMPKQIKNAHI